MKDDKRSVVPSSGFSRREFLKGSGAAAAATAVGQAAVVAAESETATAAKVVGPEPLEVTMDVNGQQRKATVEPRTTLLEVLRYQFDLTGAKPISEDGSSGGSTVLMDGKPVSASTVLALEALGRKIRTVESLGGEKLDPVPAAFVANDAQQCGFCTPGFVVAVRAFLDRNPRATEEEIRAGLNGNICRCGTYANVIQAALDVVKGDSSA